MPLTERDLAIDPRLLERLRGIDLRSRLLVRGLYSNRHRTRDFGASNEFIEHRDYHPGDELRTIDWRVYARTDRLYVKRFEMEAMMKVHLVLDTSDSMRVPAERGLPTKLELAATIAGAVAMMAVAQQDAAGLYCLGDAVAEVIPPSQGERHLGLLYRHLAAPAGRGGGTFGDLLGQLGPRLAARGVVFVLSDLLDDLDPLFQAVRRLTVREQDVTLFQILDESELTFPFDRMTEFRHPESRSKVVGEPLALRERYLRGLGAHLAAIEAFCRKSGVDYLRIHTGEDLVALLASHFLRRLLLGRC
jgi:uncharacterized protein (DUF58 family)